VSTSARPSARQRANQATFDDGPALDHVVREELAEYSIAAQLRLPSES
jgi:hypothetical protein